MKKIITISLVLLIGSSLVGQAQETKNYLIPSEKLKKDLHILKYNLEAIHAGLYTYTAKTTLDSFFVALENKITTPMSEVDFYRLALPLNNYIRNGHTLIIPSESWSQYVATKAIHLPFDIFIDKDDIFILRNFSEENLIKEGDQLMEIDGISTKDILNQLLDCSNKDGYIETYSLEIIKQDFSEYFANIIAAKSEYDILLKRKDKIITLKIKGKTLEEIRKIARNKYQFNKLPWYAGIDNPPLEYRIEKGIAILKLPTFSIDNIKDNGINFKTFFQNTFNDIHEKEINSIIIDLRGNGGGHADVGSELFSYLHDKPFRLIKDIHTITRKLPNKEYYSGKIFWQSILMKLALKKIDKSKYVPRKFAAKKNDLTLGYINPSFPQYKGEVYVLTDGWVFSASAMFAGLVKNYSRGVFIGEETGGNPKVQIGDFEQMLILPHSNLRIRIPLFFQEMDFNLPNTKQGIIPDIKKKNNMIQEINKIDHVMNWTLEMIQKNLPD